MPEDSSLCHSAPESSPRCPHLLEWYPEDEGLQIPIYDTAVVSTRMACLQSILTISCRTGSQGFWLLDHTVRRRTNLHTSTPLDQDFYTRD